MSKKRGSYQKKTLFLLTFLSIILSIISVIIPVLSAQRLLKLTNGLLDELFGVALFIFINAQPLSPINLIG